MTPEIQPQQQIITPPLNPLMVKLRVPPEIHRIPSGASFYSEVTMDTSSKGEVHIHPMTAIEEIDIKSPDLLFNGEAIVNLLRKCVTEIRDPNELFIKDVDFLMTAIRKATFGPEYEINYKHDCTEAKEHSYIIDLNVILSSAKELNPITFRNISTVTIGNDESTYLVTLTPMKLKHMIQMLQSIDRKLSEDERKTKLFSSLVMMIQDIDGITDPDQLIEFISSIPTTWVEKITQQAEKISQWGPVFKQTAICKDCGVEVELEININPLSFFTS